MISTGHGPAAVISHSEIPLSMHPLALRLSNLPEKIRLEFDSEFTKRLFDECNLPLQNLAEKLSISYPYLLHSRRNRYSLPSQTVRSLSELSGISHDEIERNFICMRARSGHRIYRKLPIEPSVKLASLVGHVFGDGYIGRKRKSFEYCNFNPVLVDKVKSEFRKAHWTSRWRKTRQA